MKSQQLFLVQLILRIYMSHEVEYDLIHLRCCFVVAYGVNWYECEPFDFHLMIVINSTLLENRKVIVNMNHFYEK